MAADQNRKGDVYVLLQDLLDQLQRDLRALPSGTEIEISARVIGREVQMACDVHPAPNSRCR